MPRPTPGDANGGMVAPANPLAGMSVDAIESAIGQHWRAWAIFYLAEILAGEYSVEELRRDLQSLINAALCDPAPPPDVRAPGGEGV